MMKKVFKCFVALVAIAAAATGPARAQSTKTFDFSFETIGFDGWSTQYAAHSYSYTEGTVYFESANKQTSTISDVPVTKGRQVSFVMVEDYTISAVTFTCRQWGTKPQTITLHYSTDGGANYTSTGVTSNSFTISSSSLPEGTNAVGITFSSTTNQVGIESVQLTYSGGSQQGGGSQGSGTSEPATPQEYTLDSIPMGWQVKVGEASPVSPTAYTEGNTQKGYATILERARVELIPSAADKNLIKSIALVDNSVPAGPAFNNVAGTFEWTVGNESSATVSDSIQEAISATGVTVGSGLTYNDTTSYGVTQMLKYQPQTSNAGVVAGVMVEYRIETVGGVKFTPTAIEYAAMKLGTDNVSYSWSYTLDGVESSIATVTQDDILRSNGNNSSTAQLMHGATLTATECDVFTLRFYVSGFPSTKQMGLGKVTISGTVNGVASGN